MIRYTSQEFSKIQKNHFPNLYFENDEKKIMGELNFCSRYKDVGRGGISRWIIEPCNQNESDCIEDAYSVKIDFARQRRNGFPKVYEVDGRIKSLADSINKPYADLHINHDGTCCLGIFPPFHNLSAFITEAVYPYFVWQAYYEKYKNAPPCGACPHDWKEAINTRIKDEKDNLKRLLGEQKDKPKNIFKNGPCACGSGKKYKECCLVTDKELDRQISQVKYCLSFLRKELTKQPRKHNFG